MGKTSRNKGSAFERKVAKQLAEWSGVELKRTPLSGGWAHQNPRVAGDITNIGNEVFPFTIECKHQEKWEWEAIIQGSSKPFESWWIQLKKSTIPNTIPLLIFKKNYFSTWIAFPALDNGCILYTVNTHYQGDILTIMEFSKWLERYSVKELIEMYDIQQ